MAVTLDPRNKHEYLLWKWDRKHILSMRRKTESIFNEFRLSHNVTASVDIPDSPSEFEANLIDEFNISEWRFRGAMISKKSKLQLYLKSVGNSGGGSHQQGVDILAWWKVNQGEYPIFSHIAIDLYAIPGISAKVERVFSGLYLFFCSSLQGELEYYESKEPIENGFRRVY